MAYNVFHKEHEQFRQQVRRFLSEKVSPRVEEWGAERRIPREVWREMGRLGFLGFCYDPAYGGSGADEVVAYLNRVLQTLGANTVGGVGVVLGGDPETIVPAEGRAYELGKRLAQAIANKETYPEQERFHAAMQERMQALVTANKDRWQHEYDYWQAAGRIP